MNTKRILVSVCAGIVTACLLAGCSSSGPTPPLADNTQQESPLPTQASPQENMPPASAAKAESPPPASAGEEVNPPPTSTTEEVSTPPTNPAEPVTGPAAQRYTPRTGDGVDVVYFEAKNPCSCMAKIGDAIEKTILTYFQDELQSGELRYFLVVSNLPENNDLVDMFHSQVFELCIAEFQDGQMATEALAEIWILKNSPSKLEDFVHMRILSSLEAQR